MVQYFKNIWLGLSTAIQGMRITSRHLFIKKVTIQYPKERFPLPEVSRNRLNLEMNRCTGCKLCTMACPVNCITIETVKVTPDDPHKEFYENGKERKLWVTKYEIDFAKCCFCGLCVESCPSDAVQHTVEYEYSDYKREGLIYHFQTLTPEQSEEKERMFAEFQAKKESNQEEKKPGRQNATGETNE